MEKKRKKHYEKPTLKGATAFEAAAAVCCKTTFGSCSASARDSKGGTRTRNTS